jgi:hypothetical protein
MKKSAPGRWEGSQPGAAGHEERRGIDLRLEERA